LTAPPGSWEKGEEKLKIPDEKHALVLAFTDSLTLLGPTSSSSQTVSEGSEFGVPKTLITRLESHFSHKEIVELAGTVASYNCVSRFLLALNVGEREGREGLEVAVKHVTQSKGGEELGKLLGGDFEKIIPAPRIYV